MWIIVIIILPPIKILIYVCILQIKQLNLKCGSILLSCSYHFQQQGALFISVLTPVNKVSKNLSLYFNSRKLFLGIVGELNLITLTDWL